MSLALFDLDNTLLAGDSDYLWNCYLAEQNLVDQEHYRRENDRFYRDYQEGQLDIAAYQRFQLSAMAKLPAEELLQWRRRFIDQVIRPIVLPKAVELIANHRQQGDRLVIITATNRFVTEPIADLFNVPTLIATEPQWQDDRLTGDIVGIPCYQQGKVERMEQWLKEHHMTWAGSWCYSDSHNDLPLLYKVDHAVAVNPDDRLQREAQTRQWPIMDLRQ